MMRMAMLGVLVLGCGSDLGSISVEDSGARGTEPPAGDDAGANISFSDACGDDIDGDLDGRVDEGCDPCALDEERECFEGDEAFAGVGACVRGVQRCVEVMGGEFASTGWGMCEGAVVPVSEVCDDATDNDCDGEVDEGCGGACALGERRECFEGEEGLIGVGACRAGAQVCVERAGMDPTWGRCESSITPVEETCDDAVDNDCDGMIDEGCETDPTRPASCAESCEGAERLIYNERYDLWVRAVLCSPERYDLFLGAEESGPFYKIGDRRGHGQDHCELVNEAFRLPDETDVRSGGCRECSVARAGPLRDLPELAGSPFYIRAVFGTDFWLVTREEYDPAFETSCHYECGVSL